MGEPFRPQLVMHRPHLTGLPPVVLPAGCTIRSLRGPEDDAAWDRIYGDSFGNAQPAGSFGRIMRPDPAFREDRVLFLCRDSEPVATASAWFVAKYGERIGFLHYVGVLKAHAGKGLGLQVSLACLHKMVEEGRTSARLQTDDFRLPAIKQYLRLGFVPLLVHENQRARWREVLTTLAGPALVEQHAASLSVAVCMEMG